MSTNSLDIKFADLSIGAWFVMSADIAYNPTPLVYVKTTQKLAMELRRYLTDCSGGQAYISPETETRRLV